MNLEYSEQQRLLRRTAREFLADACPPSLVRDIEASRAGFAPRLWSDIVQLGWTRLGLPTEHGGLGGDAVDLALLTAELGRVLAPVPWLSTIWSTHLLAHSSSASAQNLLDGVLDGRSVVAVAIREADLGYNLSTNQTAMMRDDSVWRVDGEKRFVIDGAIADTFLVIGRSGDGDAIAVVPADSFGVTILPQATIAADPCASLRLQAAESTDVIDAHPGILEGPTTLATALTAWWMIGAAERALELTVAYAKERVQFGRPIGSFQAISHKLADVRVRLDGARMLASLAVSEIAAGAPALLSVSMAKFAANTATRWALYRCHEVFAGVAFMRVHDLQLYFRRLKAAETWLGDDVFHRRRVVSERLLARVG